jgi:malate permease and related proteins
VGMEENTWRSKTTSYLYLLSLEYCYDKGMNIFLITLQAVAALLGIGVLGFWIIGRRRMPENALGLLTSIAIDITLPCLALANILIQFSPQKFPDWWHMPLWWLGFTAVALVLSLVTSFLARKGTRGEFAMSLFFQNGLFFPLIIITGLFLKNTSDYLVLLFLLMFLQPSLIFSTYSLFFRGKPQAPALNWKRIINPVLVVTLAGLLLGLGGLSGYIPTFLIMILSLIGAMAIPLFMLILGGNVYNDFMRTGAEGRKIYTAEVIKFTLVKNLLFPLVFLGILILIRPDYFIAFLIILEAAVPPITAIPIFTERSGGNRALTNQYIVASFIFSMVSIPAVIYLFSHFFPFPG